ncbi:uncharacterized protein EMH_0016650 [Eimeria mitis]|uniref:Uncharacterized protein n=1 Tax=Eimeria mitis TaxID=44415 RepID=U6KBG7_9EIME|nr:uncharacterized protein EMH_0016650 [Eimeria mitis]CDJ33577.1 hypothetical protein EMH_0016650 [Eimeria mitis]
MAAVKGPWKFLIVELLLCTAYVSPISLSVATRGTAIASQGAGTGRNAFIKTLGVPCGLSCVKTGETFQPGALCGAGLRHCGEVKRSTTARNLSQRHAGWSARRASPHVAAAAGGESAEEVPWGRWGGFHGNDLPVSCVHSGNWAREEPRAAFSGFSSPRYIPRGHRGPVNSPGISLYPTQERGGFGGSLSPFLRPPSFARRLYNAQDGYLPPPEAQQFPRDIRAFQEAMNQLDSKFLQFAKETASPTAK